MSKITCLAPWVHSHVSASDTRRLCCVANKDIPMNSHDDFWNGEYMKGVRKKFLNGEKIAECSNCFSAANKEEDARYYKTFDRDFGGMVDDIVLNTNAETGETTVMPVYLDYRNSLCNLTCKTCYSGSSSSIVAASNRSINGQVFIPINYKKTFDQQWNDFEKILTEKTKKIYWAGGEPLMNPMYWRTMDHLLKMGWTHIEMFYNTNLTKLVDDESYNKALLFFRSFPTKINLSIDGIGEVNDYVRAGSKWNEVDLVIRKIVRDLPDAIALDCTLTNVTFLQLPLIMKYAESVGASLTSKAMMESQGTKFGGLWHDSNTFLSMSLISKDTFEKVYEQVKAIDESCPDLQHNIIDLLDWLRDNISHREISEIDIETAKHFEQRHHDEWSIIDVLKDQNLNSIPKKI